MHGLDWQRAGEAADRAAEAFEKASDALKGS